MSDDLRISDKVVYIGANRPWLGLCTGVIVSSNASNSSFLVDFRHNVTGKLYSEWVGRLALDKVESVSTHSELIKSLEADLASARKEMTDITNRLGELRKAEGNLVGAITALKKL